MCVTESSLLLASFHTTLAGRSNSTRASLHLFFCLVWFALFRAYELYYCFARNDASVNTCVVDSRLFNQRCVCYIKQNILSVVEQRGGSLGRILAWRSKNKQMKRIDMVELHIRVGFLVVVVGREGCYTQRYARSIGVES